MIRFSAALVAVAIGVLIGGIATSKLLLVYVAIVVSAVALVALAIGVVLKRGELFGETRGAPAPAGAGPVPSAHAGDSDDNRNRSNGQEPPSPLPGTAVGPGAAFAGYGQATSPQREGTRPGGAWDTAWMGGDAWPPPATATSFSAAGQAPSPSGATATDWGTPAAGKPTAAGDPAAQGAGTESGPWGASAPSVFAPRTADMPAAGPGAARSGWFSRSDGDASAGAQAPQAGTAWSWLHDDTRALADDGQEHSGRPGETAAVDEDDDWPSRYSWLNDGPEEGGTAGDAAGTSAPAMGVPAAGVGLDDPAPAAPVTPSAPGTPGTGPVDSGTAGAAGAPAEEAGPAAPAGEGEPATLHVVRDPDVAAEGAQAPGEPQDGSPSTAAANEAGPVIVLPGVPRFHQPDCVLIRFMSADDTQEMSAAQAKEAGCTPCAACQPER